MSFQVGDITIFPGRGVGKVISREGNLDANTLDVGLVWRFGTPK